MRDAGSRLGTEIGMSARSKPRAMTAADMVVGGASRTRSPAMATGTLPSAIAASVMRPICLFA
jgi:hypothetical protein